MIWTEFEIDLPQLPGVGSFLLMDETAHDDDAEHQHQDDHHHNSSFTNFLELSLFYLMVLTYFCMFWIWPSKHLLVAIDEVMMMVDRVPDWLEKKSWASGLGYLTMVMVMMTTITQMEPRNFLPWILSALVHSVIIYGLYGVHGALDLDTPRGLDNTKTLFTNKSTSATFDNSEHSGYQVLISWRHSWPQ